MKANPSGNTGRIAIGNVLIKVESIGYSFREQPTSDFGIDAHVEIIENNQATGRMIAAQIKGGPSWFREKTSEGIVYRGDKQHLQYWLNSSLPVIIILYDIESNTAYWQSVTSELAQSTGKRWKIIVPFTQKIDEASKEQFRKIAGVTIDMDHYSISSLRDVSHNAAKRYSANILLHAKSTPAQIKQVVILATQDIRHREYYRNDIVKSRWGKQPAQVVFLFVYQSVEDMQHANWICQSQWVDSSLPPQFSPQKLEGEEIGGGIIVRWSERYTTLRRFYQKHTTRKEDYLQELHELLNALQSLVQGTLQLTNSVEAEAVSEEKYSEGMRRLEPKITELYMKSSEMDLAPYECQHINSSFKSAISFAHNIVLPFSPGGSKTWNAKQRSYLVADAINNYQEEMQRLKVLIETLK